VLSLPAATLATNADPAVRAAWLDDTLRTGLLGALTACWVGAELDDRMRLNNWSIAASYDTARIFAGFGSSTAQVDRLAPAPHRFVLRQHAGVGLCSGSIRHFKRRVMGGM
jgi:hypothetical protein